MLFELFSNSIKILTVTPDRPDLVIQVPSGQKPQINSGERAVPLVEGVPDGDTIVDYYEVRKAPQPSEYTHAGHSSKD